jgi:hypothetical protein
MRHFMPWILAAGTVFFALVWLCTYWTPLEIGLVGPRVLIYVGAMDGSAVVVFKDWYGPTPATSGWAMELEDHPLSFDDPHPLGWGSFLILNCHTGFRWETGMEIPLWLPTLLFGVAGAYAWRRRGQRRIRRGFPAESKCGDATIL